MARVSVPDPNAESDLARGENAKFEALMRRYKAVDEKIAVVKREKADLEAELSNVKQLLREEVLNMGVSKGSTLRVEGVGKFHFTTQRYYRVPSGDEREHLVRLLVAEGSQSLLTIGKKDLNDWCRDRKDSEEAVPDYIKFHEDKHVPVISLTKSGS